MGSGLRILGGCIQSDALLHYNGGLSAPAHARTRTATFCCNFIHLHALRARTHYCTHYCFCTHLLRCIYHCTHLHTHVPALHTTARTPATTAAALISDGLGWLIMYAHAAHYTPPPAPPACRTPAHAPRTHFLLHCTTHIGWWLVVVHIIIIIVVGRDRSDGFCATSRTHARTHCAPPHSARAGSSCALTHAHCYCALLHTGTAHAARTLLLHLQLCITAHISSQCAAHLHTCLHAALHTTTHTFCTRYLHTCTAFATHTWSQSIRWEAG